MPVGCISRLPGPGHGSRTRALVAALLLLGACANFPWAGGEQVPPLAPGAAKPDNSRAVVELQNIDYDGGSLRGRLLISAEGGALHLDKRLMENVALSVRGVADCVSGQELYFIKAGVIAAPLREEDLLVLKPGYWYGKQVYLPLFDQSLLKSQGRPQCVDVELVFNPLQGAGVHWRVRASQPLPPGHPEVR